METIAHIAGHVLEHSLADTLYLIPFLFVTYLAMEWLEHKTGGKTQEARYLVAEWMTMSAPWSSGS